MKESSEQLSETTLLPDDNPEVAQETYGNQRSQEMIVDESCGKNSCAVAGMNAGGQTGNKEIRFLSVSAFIPCLDNSPTRSLVLVNSSQNLDVRNDRPKRSDRFP
jgi:hypothetical protein